MDNQEQIRKLRKEVQQLADKLHSAKVRLDKESHYVGLNTAKGRENWKFWKRYRQNPYLPDPQAQIYNKAAKEYREARQNYWRAKGLLDYHVLKSTYKERNESIHSSVLGVRDRMKRTFGPQITKASSNSDAFNLEDHPKVIEALEKSITEALKEANRNPTPVNAAVLLETLAAAYQVGYENVKPTHSEAAWKAAERIMETEYKRQIQILKNAGIVDY